MKQIVFFLTVGFCSEFCFCSSVLVLCLKFVCGVNELLCLSCRYALSVTTFALNACVNNLTFVM